MKLVKKNQVREHKNSENCIAFEYDHEDQDIDIAVVKVTGRYPETGYVVNSKCKEMVYVISGRGIVVVENQRFEVEAGDSYFIDAGEKFYCDNADFELAVSCTPRWNPEQHLYIEE
ncbi:MAG: cupin domain-containing protein [Acidimicrobiia bacterium]